jgi:hypothetical protein
MSFDLTVLSPKARVSYIALGRHYGSTDTLAQANQTLQGVASHGSELIPHGFAEADAERLHGARDALVDAGVWRNEARSDKKVTGATLAAAMNAGKSARTSARSVLTSTRRALQEQDDPAAETAVKKLDAVLAQTRAAGSEAGELAGQLDVLRGVLSEPAVGTAASTRGGPQAEIQLHDRATALRSAVAAHAGAAGTPAESEHLDLLDGIVVTFARNARQAARAAAKRLGKPALAADFELTKLYGPRSGVAATKPAAAAQPAPSNGAPAPSAAPSVS